MRARQRAAQGLKVSTTQDSRGLVLKSSLCVEDGAIRACQDQSAKRGRRGKSAKSEAKVKPGRRSRPAGPAQPAQPAKSKRVLPCTIYSYNPQLQNEAFLSSFYDGKKGLRDLNTDTQAANIHPETFV